MAKKKKVKQPFYPVRPEDQKLLDACRTLSYQRIMAAIRAKGKKIPVAGISDCHGCDGDLAGWFYTIVFADKLDFDSIAEAIRDERSVAVHWIPGEHPVVVGPFRLTKFVYFLIREFYPDHDALCNAEGEIMRRDIAGYGETDAAAQIRSRSGAVRKFMEQFWGK